MGSDGIYDDVAFAIAFDEVRAGDGVGTFDFAADGVEAGEQNCTGGVVDEDSDAGGSFEGADVAAFASNDAALDVVALKGNGRGGIFEGVFAGVALNGDTDDAAGLFFGFGFGFVEDVAR